jgi:hypothetical protein
MQIMYIGVDPGKSGGIVFMYDGTIELFSMPDTEKDVCEMFYTCPTSFAVIEKVQGYIGKPHPGSAMFNFGMNYGGLRMAMIAAQIPFEEVTPRTWQKELGISPRKKVEKPNKFKSRIKAKAQQLFPKLNVTLKTCDALLIAEYCRRVRS